MDINGKIIAIAIIYGVGWVLSTFILMTTLDNSCVDTKWTKKNVRKTLIFPFYKQLKAAVSNYKDLYDGL